MVYKVVMDNGRGAESRDALLRIGERARPKGIGLLAYYQRALIDGRCIHNGVVQQR